MTLLVYFLFGFISGTIVSTAFIFLIIQPYISDLIWKNAINWYKETHTSKTAKE